jgi:hypothetical protein
VDPVKWWGALTEQFTEIAAQALKATPVMATGLQAADAPAPAAKRSPGSRAKAATAKPAKPATFAPSAAPSAAPASRKAAPAAKRSRSATR